MLPGASAAPRPCRRTAGTGGRHLHRQTEKHRDVAEFLTRLGLIPQLMDITLTSSTDASGTTPTTTASSAPTATFKQFTVTSRLRPYTTTPPATTLQAVAP